MIAKIWDVVVSIFGTILVLGMIGTAFIAVPILAIILIILITSWLIYDYRQEKNPKDGN